MVALSHAMPQSGSGSGSGMGGSAGGLSSQGGVSIHMNLKHFEQNPYCLIQNVQLVSWVVNPGLPDSNLEEIPHLE